LTASPITDRGERRPEAILPAAGTGTAPSARTTRFPRQCFAGSIALGVAIVFAFGGFAKLADPTLSLVFFKTGLGIPVFMARWIVVGISCAEIGLAAWLAYDLGRSCRSAWAALVLVGFFSGLLLAAHELNPASSISCGCFGQLQPPLGGRSLLSQLKLDALLAVLLLMQIRLQASVARG